MTSFLVCFLYCDWYCDCLGRGCAFPVGGLGLAP